MIQCLINCANEISSTFNLFHQDVQKLLQFFSANSYPQFLFDIYLKKYLDNVITPKLPVLSVPKLPIYIVLPYLGNPNRHCKKKLTSIINRFFPQVDFKCIFVNRNTIGSFFPLKDQIPLMVSSKIIIINIYVDSVIVHM